MNKTGNSLARKSMQFRFIKPQLPSCLLKIHIKAHLQQWKQWSKIFKPELSLQKYDNKKKSFSFSDNNVKSLLDFDKNFDRFISITTVLKSNHKFIIQYNILVNIFSSIFHLLQFFFCKYFFGIHQLPSLSQNGNPRLYQARKFHILLSALSLSLSTWINMIM